MSPRPADERCVCCPRGVSRRIEPQPIVAPWRLHGDRPAADSATQPALRSPVLSPMVHEEAFMIHIKSLAVIGALALATAACGDRPVDRALTGGAIGAGGG